MTVATQSFIHGLWLVQLALLAILCLVLLARRTWKGFPFFATYSFFHLGTGLIELFLYKNPRIYIYVFVVVESIAVILGLAVAYEIFAHLFSSQVALRKLARNLLFAVVIVLAVLGLWVVRSHTAHGVRGVASAVVVTEEAARLLEVGLLVFLFVCSSTFGLHWRQPVFGVALGLAIFTTVELILVAVRAQLGARSVAMFSIVRMLAFNISIVTWIGYLLRPERVSVAAPMPDRSQLEQWNRAVMELIHQ